LGLFTIPSKVEALVKTPKSRLLIKAFYKAATEKPSQGSPALGFLPATIADAVKSFLRLCQSDCLFIKAIAFATGQIPANKVQYKACVKNENPASAGLKTAGDRSGPGDIDTSGFSIIYEQKFLSIMENVKA